MGLVGATPGQSGIMWVPWWSNLGISGWVIFGVIAGHLGLGTSGAHPGRPGVQGRYRDGHVLKASSFIAFFRTLLKAMRGSLATRVQGEYEYHTFADRASLERQLHYQDIAL